MTYFAKIFTKGLQKVNNPVINIEGKIDTCYNFIGKKNGKEGKIYVLSELRKKT